MIATVETARFLLRPFRSSDKEGIFALDSNPEVLKYLGNKPMRTMEEAEKLIDYIRRQYRENGIGRWVIEDKLNGAFIGWAGLKFVTETTNNRSDYHDIGYRLLPEHWGKGIATECAIASLEFGFETLNLEVIHAGAHQENAASNHILQKIGLRLIEPFAYDGEPQNWYTIRKNDWN